MIAIKPSAEILSGKNYHQMLENIERIGRVCYKSEDAIHPGSAEQFIRNIITRGHESVIEHESISVRVVCDRGVSHEIVRHRIASYSQESTRYCNYTRDKFGSQLVCIDIATGFRYNLEDPADRKKYDIWTKAMEAAEGFYFQLIEAGARPEEARSVLPNSLKTEIVMTMNLREWRHFLRLRSSKRAHPQIAEIASALLEEFSARYPVFFADLRDADQ
ncbi:MAG: FAD-dependent thymidylate synthase [Oscillospiraceae bacterium]|jgi:thymidylate synthase (FAD)|nr:FAD-dependent thymidylate synthase [Oscillospiraceae bacterium]